MCAHLLLLYIRRCDLPWHERRAPQQQHPQHEIPHSPFAPPPLRHSLHNKRVNGRTGCGKHLPTRSRARRRQPTNVCISTSRRKGNFQRRGDHGRPPRCFSFADVALPRHRGGGGGAIALNGIECVCVCVNASHIAKLMTACDDDDDGGCGCARLRWVSAAFCSRAQCV